MPFQRSTSRSSNSNQPTRTRELWVPSRPTENDLPNRLDLVERLALSWVVEAQFSLSQFGGLFSCLRPPLFFNQETRHLAGFLTQIGLSNRIVILVCSHELFDFCLAVQSIFFELTLIIYRDRLDPQALHVFSLPCRILFPQAHLLRCPQVH